MRQMRCRVGAAVLAPNYGKTLTIGQVVDVDERLPSGGTLADVTHPDWFAPLLDEPDEASTAPVRRHLTGTHTRPESPAAEA